MNKKNYIRLTSYICAIIFSILTIISNYVSINILQILSSIVTGVDFVIIFYCECLWKYINFFKIPNLNGNYSGFIKYGVNYQEEKKIEVIIKQSLFEIKVNFKTNESQSISCLATLFNNNGNRELVYLYRTDSNIEFRDKNPDQWGTTRLHLLKNRLVGEYWTSRKTSGKIELIKENLN